MLEIKTFLESGQVHAGLFDEKILLTRFCTGLLLLNTTCDVQTLHNSMYSHLLMGEPSPLCEHCRELLTVLKAYSN